jgi:hypothetical protein
MDSAPFSLFWNEGNQEFKWVLPNSRKLCKNSAVFALTGTFLPYKALLSSKWRVAPMVIAKT